MFDSEHLERIYSNRFTFSQDQRSEIWQFLCQRFFQRWIPVGASVLDVGAGRCEFINHITCHTKYALDLSEHCRQFANPDVTVFIQSITETLPVPKNSLDRVFSSNFFEHLPDKATFLKALQVIYSHLKPGGKILILMPNIRYAYAVYWDFLDHFLPLSHHSLCEALRLTGFRVEKVIPRFLPYTTCDSLPFNPILARLYLSCPFLWRWFGKQMFIVAQKP